MLCDRCHSRNATVHLNEIMGGADREIHLCEKCSRDVGLNRGGEDLSLSIPDMLTFLDVKEVSPEEVSVCRCCGMTYLDFQKTGRLGCSDCYVYFSKSNVIAGNMPDSPYGGKIPENYRIASEGAGEIVADEFSAGYGDSQCVEDSLQFELERAIDDERYEEAALLRDRIQECKRKEGSRG